jgi:hypothetical protein
MNIVVGHNLKLIILWNFAEIIIYHHCAKTTTWAVAIGGTFEKHLKMGPGRFYLWPT